MAAVRTLLCLVFATAPAFWLPVAAQASHGLYGAHAPNPGNPPRGAWLPGGRSYLGLNVGRSRSAACGSTALLCDDADRPTELYTGTMVGKFWAVEVGYLNLGRLARPAGEARAQGLNISLVGKLAPSLRAYGKLGASSGALPSEQGFGLSFGGGLSLDFTPRLSATIEWDSNDFRFGGSGRDPVRSTSLGLQYRY